MTPKDNMKYWEDASVWKERKPEVGLHEAIYRLKSLTQMGLQL